MGNSIALRADRTGADSSPCWGVEKYGDQGGMNGFATDGGAGIGIGGGNGNGAGGVPVARTLGRVVESR
jgi:hypothetical protein